MTSSIGRLSAALSDRYRVDREVGEGGMATVYLAEDLKHGRQVAVKVLKPELAAVVGKERFFAEIETTAQLQHPNILPLFDSGEADGMLFYCMPYVEGESLADRLRREKQLPVDVALDLTRKLAAALDYAHQRGVVHRDIKPANILLSSGEPLIADFGIALAVSQAGDGRITETGLSLGTPHYMSPEQASGDRSLDPRSDVYALGCVLYEMLLGEPPFPGPSAQAVLARILTSAPTRVTKARPTVPRHVDAVVARALEKLPADRFATVADLRRALDDPSFRHLVSEPEGAGPPPAHRGAVRSPSRALPTLAGLLAVAVVAAGWGWLRPRAEEPVRRFRVDVDVSPANGRELALSPDGSQIVYRGADQQLYLRPVHGLEGTAIPGTQGARGPFFSPDGRSIGFNWGQPDAMYTLALSGGTPVRIGSPDEGVSVPGTWSEDGYIYYEQDAGARRGILRAPAQGGASELVLEGAEYRWPVAIPGVTDRILVTSQGRGVGVVDVAQGTFRPIAGLEQATEVRIAGGYAFWRAGDGTLAAAGFDADAERVTTPPVTLARGVGMEAFTVSRTGVLIHGTGGASSEAEQVYWLDRDGTRTLVNERLGAALGDFEGLRISPDGRHLALEVYRNPGGNDEARIFIYDLEDASWQQLTFEGTYNYAPSWLPDGRVAFVSDQGGGWQIWAKPFDRSAEETLLFAPGVSEFAGFDASPVEGQPMVVAHRPSDEEGGLYLVDPTPGATPTPFLVTRFREVTPAISPDGNWVAYRSDESGDWDIYVRPYPGGGRPYPIALESSLAPAWGTTSEELFYVTREGIHRAELDLSDGVRVERRGVVIPRTGTLEAVTGRLAMYDVAPDGRIVAVGDNVGGPAADDEVPGSGLPVVVLNVFREIEERLANTGGG